MNVHIVFTWILFLGIMPLSYFWLRRAWKIIKEKDYSYVALRKGLPPANPQKYAPYSAIINLSAGIIFFVVFFWILLGGLNYDIWSAIVGVTLWMKIFADVIVSRIAHMKWKHPKSK